jgi:hypothetical protein
VARIERRARSGCCGPAELGTPILGHSWIDPMAAGSRHCRTGRCRQPTILGHQASNFIALPGFPGG